MKTADIAQRYLNFFEKNDHVILPSASLVSDDPSLLFTVAGMVPFIPYLTGVVPAPFPRAADVQKCIRTNDIEEVGHTARHGTFFQMLGNWSFGDYFKEGAISYAWELLTSSEADGGLGFAERDLWVTVYEDDDDAAKLWRKIAGLPEDRIQRLGREDNYWSTGQPGPAGPCSEIYFDRGPKYGADGGPAVDDNRFTEIWNLVFMQYAIDEVKSKTEFKIVGELPHKNIDTGMGLERVAFIKQGVENMYEIDQVRPVLDRAVELSGRAYGKDHEDDIRYRVVADHIRSSLMLLSDGVTPSNEGRGYILRRLMRRSIRSMRLLGVDGPTFPELFAASKDAMASAYPVLEQDYERIAAYAFAEEDTFLRTLSSGSSILDLAVSDTKAKGESKLSGKEAFLLHDTYGFPIDLTLEIAQEAGLDVDRGAFDELMTQQRDRAKADAKSRKKAISDSSVYRQFRMLGETAFTGYDALDTEAKVLGLIVDGIAVERVNPGQTAEVILSETSLYAEAGGQVADKGQITADGVVLDVLDVQTVVPGLVSHTVSVAQGSLELGQSVTTRVDRQNRIAAGQAHSATHLVHAALRDTLGESATQAGSLNRAGYLRFDFKWSQSLSDATRSEIEAIANDAVQQNYEVTTRVLSLEEAKAQGARALFGEKYGERVRMVDIGGPWSRELCGGTHIAASGQIGLISLLGEASVGAGNRRVEALVGKDAFKQLASERAIISQLSADLKAPREELPTRINDLAKRLRAAEKKIVELESAQRQQLLPDLLNSATVLGRFTVIAQELADEVSGDELRTLALGLRDRLSDKPAIVVLLAASGDKPIVLAATTEAAREQGANAGALVKSASAVLGGGGGGRADVAQGGGADSSKSAAALEAVKSAIGQL